jgi:hypothetical protein
MKKFGYALVPALAFCCSSLAADELGSKINRPQFLSEEFFDQLCDLDEEEAFEFFHTLLSNVERDYGIALDIEQMTQAAFKIIVDSGEFNEEELRNVEEFYENLVEWSHVRKSKSWSWGSNTVEKPSYAILKCQHKLCDVIQQRLQVSR